MAEQRKSAGSELFIVDNSDNDWKVARYLRDWCRLSSSIDIATATLAPGSADGMPRNEFITFVAAELGYKRTPKAVAKAIDNALRAAAQRGIIYTEQGSVFTDCRTIADYPRDLLKAK